MSTPISKNNFPKTARESQVNVNGNTKIIKKITGSVPGRTLAAISLSFCSSLRTFSSRSLFFSFFSFLSFLSFFLFFPSPSQAQKSYLSLRISPKKSPHACCQSHFSKRKHLAEKENPTSFSPFFPFFLFFPSSFSFLLVADPHMEEVYVLSL